MKTYTTEIINKQELEYSKGVIGLPKIYYRNIVGTRKPNLPFILTYEEQLEWTKCYLDIIYFAEKYCKIRGADIILRDYQKELIKSILNNRFNINASSLQSGITIVISIIGLYQSIFTNGYTSLIIGYNRSSVIEKLEKIKDIYISLPFFLKPGIQTWESTVLTFDNGSAIKTNSGSKSIAIGFSPDHTLIDGYAYMHPSLLNNILPVVSARKNDKLTITSTPNGTNHFYELFTDSERKEGDPKKNAFVPSRVYWWQVPGRDEEWKRKEILNLGSEEQFNQEYDLQFIKKK